MAYNFWDQLIADERHQMMSSKLIGIDSSKGLSSIRRQATHYVQRYAFENLLGKLTPILFKPNVFKATLPYKITPW